MVPKDKIIFGLNTFVNEYLDNMTVNNPAMCFIKPFAVRAARNKISDAEGFLNLIADKNGMIDIAGILSEITESLMNVQPFVMNIPVVGDVVIGGGRLEVGIPLLNKNVIFTEKDINYLKELLTSESYGRDFIERVPE